MLLAISPQVTAALIAGSVSVAITVAGGLWLDRRAHRLDLESDYKNDQRKALLALIGRYHGGLLEHATSWNYRMLNLFKNAPKGWLDVRGSYSSRHYYFHSCVYRFLALLSLSQLFEAEEIFIDARYVEDRELEFVKFVKAFHWVMSDVALFVGIEYGDEPVDHFYSDRLRVVCEAFLQGGDVPSFRAFEASLTSAQSDELQPAFRYFDGLGPEEDRLRWDRLVCLHILSTAFVATFGYEWQRPDGAFVTRAMTEVHHPEVLENLVAWLPKLGLDKQECLQALRAKRPAQR